VDLSETLVANKFVHSSVFWAPPSNRKDPIMTAALSSATKGHRWLTSTVFCGIFAIGLGFAAPAAKAAGGDNSGASPGSGASGAAEKKATGMKKTDLTTCAPGEVWDKKKKKCLERHSGVLPDSDLTEYAYSLAKADRYQEAIDVLDMLGNPNTPRALNYRGYATRKLGRTDEGIGYYLKSVALDPNYSQVREYLGEAYVIQGKYDLAKDQLATIEKLCGSKDCEYYEDLADALKTAHAL
jgi:tetratricopeptide (TPR) repeat protein